MLQEPHPWINLKKAPLGLYGLTQGFVRFNSAIGRVTAVMCWTLETSKPAGQGRLLYPTMQHNMHTYHCTHYSTHIKRAQVRGVVSSDPLLLQYFTKTSKHTHTQLLLFNKTPAKQSQNTLVVLAAAYTLKETHCRCQHTLIYCDHQTRTQAAAAKHEDRLWDFIPQIT